MFDLTETSSTDESYTDFFLPCFISAVFFFTMVYALTCAAEKNNHLSYESRIACIIAGCLGFFMKWHTTREPLAIPKEGGSLMAIGPHTTGIVDPAVIIANMPEGTPPRFFATTGFNYIPGVTSLMKMFQTIPVEFDSARKKSGGPRSNALEAGVNALDNKSCVALFPQGNFSYLGQRPPIVYPGAAKMAIKTQTPIHVIRLDGFWSIYNPYIPRFIKNSRVYRVLLSFLHMNNVKTTLCCVIDYHLKPENTNKPPEDIEREINARLYAYFNHAEELTTEQIGKIGEEINAGKHLELWDARLNEYTLSKALNRTTEEYDSLEKRSRETLGLT